MYTIVSVSFLITLYNQHIISRFILRTQLYVDTGRILMKNAQKSVVSHSHASHKASESEAPIQSAAYRLDIRARTTRSRGGSRRYEAAGTAHQ